MSREDPSPLEEGYIENRGIYEESCVAWQPGDPFPHPPPFLPLPYRPTTSFDNPDIYIHAFSNWTLACTEAMRRRDRRLPIKPLRLPGRPRTPKTPKAPYRPKIYAVRESIGIPADLLAALVAARQDPQEALAETVRSVLRAHLLPTTTPTDTK